MKTLSIAALSAVLFTGSIGAVSAENYLLGVAACPPWKTGPSAEVTEKMEAMCEADSKNLSSAFVERGLAEKENVSMLVQQDATVEKLDSALSDLANRVVSGDKVYVYVAMHGGVIDHKYKGYPVKGEVFAFYTNEAPADYAAAVENKVWLSARDLRDKLSTFARNTGAHVVTILEACHSAEAFHDFKHNPELHLDSEGQMAVLFSAQEDEISHFVPDYSGGRFTTDLAQSIRDADEDADLLDIFYSAAKATFEETFEHCSQFDPKIKAALYGSEKEFFEACHQKPSFYDPHGLLTENVLD